MAISLSQTLTLQNESYGSSTGEASFTSPPATNELIVIRGSFRNVDSGDNAVTVTDNKSNTYTVLQRSDANSVDDDFAVFLAYCIHAGSGSGTHTVTISHPGESTFSKLSWCGHSYSDISTVAPLDNWWANNSSTAGQTSISVVTDTLSQAAELLCGALMVNQYGDTDLNIGTDAEFTNRVVQDESQDLIGFEASDFIVAATTAVTSTWTFDSSTSKSAIVAAFRQGSALVIDSVEIYEPVSVLIDNNSFVRVTVLDGAVPVAGATVTLTSSNSNILLLTDDQIEPPPPPSSDIVIACNASHEKTVGEYKVDNNTWGAGTVTSPFTQCIGMNDGNGDGSVNARWTYSWPQEGGSSVKGYPEIIYGQKPGYAVVGTSLLPKVLNTFNTCEVSFSYSLTNMAGRGQLTFDLWVMPDATRYYNHAGAPKIMEIMLPINATGGYGVPPNRNSAWFIESATINSVSYEVYYTPTFSTGAAFLVFEPSSLLPVNGGVDHAPYVDWEPLFNYIIAKGWLTGTEYLASLEFGSEPIYGTGDVTVTNYKVDIT